MVALAARLCGSGYALLPGAGLLLAAVYDLARFFWAAQTGVLCAGFGGISCGGGAAVQLAASRSYSGVVRWYMAAALLAGLAGYFFVLAPATRALQAAIKWVLSRPFVLLWLVALRHFLGACGGGFGGLRTKNARRRQKRQKKQLKSKAQVLYNSNN